MDVGSPTRALKTEFEAGGVVAAERGDELMAVGAGESALLCVRFTHRTRLFSANGGFDTLLAFPYQCKLL